MRGSTGSCGIIKLLSALLVFSPLSPFLANVSAQEAERCGEICIPCGPDKWESVHVLGDQTYKASLNELGLDEVCHQCEGGPALGAYRRDAPEIAVLFSATTAEELPAVVEGFGARLYLNPERRLVVMRGTECGTEVLGSIVLLTAGKTRTLLRLGVTRVEGVLPALKASGAGHVGQRLGAALQGGGGDGN